jgi:hypothetical protein
LTPIFDPVAGCDCPPNPQVKANSKLTQVVAQPPECSQPSRVGFFVTHLGEKEMMQISVADLDLSPEQIA